MFDDFFQLAFFIGLIGMETIRFPHRMRNKRARRAGTAGKSYASPLDIVLDLISFTGSEVLPLVFIFSRAFDFATYTQPAGLGWAGVFLFAAALYVLGRAHRDLGVNWSPSLELAANQKLITTGIYSIIRHPIYAAVWLASFAQALLLHNWIAGLSGLVTFLPVFLVRLYKEERMMIEAFGDEYRTYMRTTGGIFPRLRQLF